MKTSILLATAAIILGSIFSRPASADPGNLTVDLQNPTHKVSPIFYGLMTEEINHSYDGGLYAELIQNRIFQDSAKQPIHWELIKTAGADGDMSLDTSDPINSTALTRSLKITVNATGAGQSIGAANEGFWGIPVHPATEYRASFFAKSAAGLSGPLTVEIQSKDGNTVYATGSVPQVSSQWKQYDLMLKTKDAAPTVTGRFVISASGTGTLWLNLVSLFPPTFNHRPNGNRIDLMQLLGDLHPAFLRFPGGNYLEGDTVAERFEWKNTIGPLEDRPGHQGPWRYRSSDGMGLLEFLEWCEDLHMQPLLAVYAGYSLRHIHVNTRHDLEPFVQDALDEIEYCTGDASTRWGAERVKDGHAAPFDIRFVEVGNEDLFDRPGNYDGRFAQFYDAIKSKYPNLQLIATAPVQSRKPDVIDDHYYRSHTAMERDVHHYDKTDRNGPRIFVGEWATTEGRPTPNFGAALADAAWLTGLERNSDVVIMNCYAPLLVNVNVNASQWGTNLIGYNALTSFGSTSYEAQKIFAQNMGDTVLPVDITEQKSNAIGAPFVPSGSIGVATWNTQAEFKDVKVTRGDQTLFQSDFSKGDTGWQSRSGEWKVADGALTQSSGATNCRMTAGDPDWQDYTYSVKARKISGSEGFLVMFHVRGRNSYVWWNVGGWGNTRSQLEKLSDGENSPLGSSADVTIEPNRWYDVRIELKGADIKCYLDNKLITEATDAPVPVPAVYASASRVDSTGEVILKVVNVADFAQDLQVNLRGAANVDKDGKLIELTGKPSDVNTIADPNKVAPVESDVHDAGPSFTHEFPAYSVSVLKLRAN